MRHGLNSAHRAHAKEIQVRLGHASIVTTMNVYGHLLPSLDEESSLAAEGFPLLGEVN